MRYQIRSLRRSQPMVEKGKAMAQVQVMLSMQPTPNPPAPVAERMVWLSMEGNILTRVGKSHLTMGCIVPTQREKSAEWTGKGRKNPPEALPEECSPEGKAEGQLRER